ncbi:MAG: hypothetical protein GY877_02635, partial [Hyphomicrobium sp.]|nr:hypothetical protein [Hyphomicrobium sp.]
GLDVGAKALPPNKLVDRLKPITFLRQKLKPPVGIEKPNLRQRAPPESICQASDSHKSEYGLFFEVPSS